MKLLLQAPSMFEPDWLGLAADDFTHRAYAAVFRSMRATRSDHRDEPASGAVWVHHVATAVPHPLLASLVAALAVEPLSLHGPATEHYVHANAAKLRLLTVMRQVSELKSKLQRTNPVENPTTYNQMFSEPRSSRLGAVSSTPRACAALSRQHRPAVTAAVRDQTAVCALICG